MLLLLPANGRRTQFAPTDLTEFISFLDINNVIPSRAFWRGIVDKHNSGAVRDFLHFGWIFQHILQKFPGTLNVSIDDRSSFIGHARQFWFCTHNLSPIKNNKIKIRGEQIPLAPAKKSKRLYVWIFCLTLPPERGHPATPRYYSPP